MRKKIIAVLIACLILLNCMPVYASVGTNTLIDSETVDETIKEREDFIIKSVNKVLESEDKEKLSSDDDIDYNKIIREFYCPDLFSDGEITKEKMREYTKDQEFSYVLPVNCNDMSVVGKLRIRKPLTKEKLEKYSEDMIEYYQSEEGKWYFSEIGSQPSLVDYKDTVIKVLEKNNIENSDVYFISGISRHIDIAALICTDNPDDARFLVLEQYGVKTGECDYLDYQVMLDINTLYTYDEIKAIVDADLAELESIPDGEFGTPGIVTQTSTPKTDNSKTIIISSVAGVAVLAIAVAAICIAKKKKTEKVTEE